MTEHGCWGPPHHLFPAASVTYLSSWPTLSHFRFVSPIKNRGATISLFILFALDFVMAQGYEAWHSQWPAAALLTHWSFLAHNPLVQSTYRLPTGKESMRHKRYSATSLSFMPSSVDFCSLTSVIYTTGVAKDSCSCAKNCHQPRFKRGQDT